MNNDENKTVRNALLKTINELRADLQKSETKLQEMKELMMFLPPLLAKTGICTSENIHKACELYELENGELTISLIRILTKNDTCILEKSPIDQACFDKLLECMEISKEIRSQGDNDDVEGALEILASVGFINQDSLELFLNDPQDLFAKCMELYSVNQDGTIKAGTTLLDDRGLREYFENLVTNHSQPKFR